MTHTEVRIVLRDADVDECFLGGWTPEEALAFSIENSTMSFLVSIEGETLCYWGFATDTVLTGGCRAWMLSTPAIEKHRVFAARRSREYLDLLLEDHYAVTVLVDPMYGVARRWLRWLGFKNERVLDRFLEMRVTRGSRV